MSATTPTGEAGRYGLDDLVQFGLIAEAGGIAAASRRHGVPKTNLSRALARLEDAAGVALFDRVGRGLRLTAFGARLVARAEDALRVSRDTERTLHDALDEPSGTLRIGSTRHTTLMLASAAIAKLHDRWPGVHASLHLVTEDAGLYGTELDVQLSLGRPSGPDLVARRILTLERGLYASRAVASTLDPTDPEAVVALPRVTVNLHGAPSCWQLSGPRGQRLTIDTPPKVVAHDPSIALDIVRNGLGMALLPRMLVERHHPANLELVRLVPRFTCPCSEVFASFPRHRTEVPAVRAFVDLLVEHARAIAADPVAAEATRDIA